MILNNNNNVSKMILDYSKIMHTKKQYSNLISKSTISSKELILELKYFLILENLCSIRLDCPSMNKIEYNMEPLKLNKRTIKYFKVDCVL